MMQPHTQQRVPIHPRGFYASRRHDRASTHDLRRRMGWGTRGVAALLMSGLCAIVGSAVGHTVLSGEAYSPVPHVVERTKVVIVKDDALPPVLQRIAQCESRGRHFARDGTVLRGTQNPRDTGLFQINTGVWEKKAQELGYDLRTPEGNTQMARYIFENYGSGPWQSSAVCWNRVG